MMDNTNLRKISDQIQYKYLAALADSQTQTISDFLQNKGLKSNIMDDEETFGRQMS